MLAEEEKRVPFYHQDFVQDASRSGWLAAVSRRLRRRRCDRQQRALSRRGWYALDARSGDDAILIGGCGRSGTTLFREILNRHPRIGCGAETSLFGLPFTVTNQAYAWDVPLAELQDLAASCANVVEYAERFFRRYLLEPAGKPRWADKTPNNVRALPKLLTWFPNGRFIHVLRDGRDVVCSLRHHPRERFINGVLTPVKTNNPVERCALRWLRDTSAGLAFRGHPRYLEVRYEDVVTDTEATLRRVCAFLGEDFDPAMLAPAAGTDAAPAAGRLVNNENAVQPISGKSLGRWQRDLTPSEQRRVADVCGELLLVTGYAADGRWVRNTRPE